MHTVLLDIGGSDGLHFNAAQSGHVEFRNRSDLLYAQGVEIMARGLGNYMLRLIMGTARGIPD